MSWLLEVDSVAKRFRGRSVLAAASLRAPAGAVTFLVGRNGCGKTTLLRIATGRIAADSGFVHFDGRTFPRPHLPRLARLGVLYVPDRDLLSSSFTVREQLGVMWRGLGRAAEGLPAGDAAERAGLGALVDRRPQALSEGERRRAEMTLALVRNPRCLLADEPFRHLSPGDAAIVGSVLRDLAARGCAVVVTGHEVQFLFDFADRVTWCTSGTTYDLGTPAEARRGRRFCAEYLGAPPEPPEARGGPPSGRVN
jgi:ABC-type multidrug transport system ATPase subunit